MQDPKDNKPNEDEKDLLDVEGQNYDDIDDLLDEIEGKPKEDNNDPSGEGNKNKNKKEEDEGEEKPKFFKKVGNREFTSEEEYDEFVKEVYNTNSRFAGAIKKLGGDPKKLSKVVVDEYEKNERNEEKQPEEKKEELSDEEQYYRIERIRFTRQFPIAEEYKDEMKLFIQKGKANIDGYPSYALALAKALRADGVEIPQKLINQIRIESGRDVSSEPTATKKVMKAGGSTVNQANHLNIDEQTKENLDDFGDKLMSGAIPEF